MKHYILSLLFLSASFSTGCGWFKTSDAGKSQKTEMRATEANQQRLLKSVPPPRMADSQERRNLVRRLTRFNTNDKISYIYLVSFGKVMAFYTVKGKVSSVNSLLTTPDQVLEVPTGGQGANPAVVISSPDLDGSYGSNGDAIFFFTTEDVYVEWRGEYMLADQPLRLVTPPALVRTIKDKAPKGKVTP